MSRLPTGPCSELPRLPRSVRSRARLAGNADGEASIPGRMRMPPTRSRRGCRRERTSRLRGRASRLPARPEPLRRTNVGDARRDVGAEARAIEDAVVADARALVVQLAVGGEGRCKDRAPPRHWPRPVMSSFSPSMVISATRVMAVGSTRRPRCNISPWASSVAHENLVDGLQVEFRRQIHHRQILVIEFAMLLGAVAVALHQMAEQILVRVHVPVEVHGHEPGQLQKARIDRAARSRRWATARW